MIKWTNDTPVAITMYGQVVQPGETIVFSREDAQGDRFGPSVLDWAAGNNYVVGQQRLADGDVWSCKVDHLSAASNEPVTGVDYATYWEIVVDAIPAPGVDGALVVAKGGKWEVGADKDPKAKSLQATEALQGGSVTAGALTASDSETGDTAQLESDRLTLNDVELTREQFGALSGVIHSTFYAAAASIIAPTIVVPADRRSLLIPSDGGIRIGNGFYKWSNIPNIDVDVAANWDSTSPTDLTVALNRRGTNAYLYECQHAGQLAPDFILSPNSTYPTGYDANNSRKVGWIHFLGCAVGTISGHPLSGYLTGDVLPRALADILNRPSCSPEGMVQSILLPEWWTDIYPVSGTGANTASAFAATISDSRTWLDFVDDLAAVGKVLPNDVLFQILAAGSNEQTNIYGSQDPVKTGLIGTKLFTGAGLNDLTLNRTAWVHAAFKQEYEIEIDGTGTPDTLKWRQKTFGGAFGGYTSTVAITAGAMVIADGLTVAFGATTGHTLGNKWNLYLMDAGFDTANRRMIANNGAEMCAGAMYQWLDTQGYRFEGAAAHTHQVVASGDPQTITSGAASGDVAPAWAWYALPGGKGQIYRQGTYGDVKLLAGGLWYNGANCGSRSCFAAYYRWATDSVFGARGCSRSKRS